MKMTIAAVLPGLGLISGSTAIAQAPGQTAEADKTRAPTLAEPDQYRDDPCWVAPEWQDF